MSETLKSLKEAIERDGICIGTDIVKVDMFLNHRLDTALLTEIGQAFRKAFDGEQIDMVLTVEASGIAAALTTAQACGYVPVVFAKKGKPGNLSPDTYQAKVYSFTHGVENEIRVSKAYLPQGSRVLIIDDFMANGEASRGLIEIVKQAKAEVVGVGICVEKGFQPGGELLRKEGYKVVSLATVMGISDGKPLLKE